MQPGANLWAIAALSTEVKTDGHIKVALAAGIRRFHDSD